VAKQPATQLPPTQVCSLPQLTPAQGSVTDTQVALHVEPPPQAIPIPITPLPAQGSDWQIPPRQTSPVAQVEAQPPELPPPPVEDPPEPVTDDPPEPVTAVPPPEPPLPDEPVPAAVPPEPESFVDDPAPPVPLDCEPLNPQPQTSAAYAKTTRPMRNRPKSSRLGSLNEVWGRSVVMIPPTCSVAACRAWVRKKEDRATRSHRASFFSGYDDR
jgi:hypothetical protein